MTTFGVDAFWVPVPELVPPPPWTEDPGCVAAGKELARLGAVAVAAAPFGEDAVAPPVRPCPPPSTYAVAVIVPVSRLEGAVDPDGGTGASFALWIVSRRPLTCSPPEAVRTVALFSFKKRRYRSAN